MMIRRMLTDAETASRLAWLRVGRRIKNFHQTRRKITSLRAAKEGIPACPPWHMGGDDWGIPLK
jgi:hypothetical protein